MSATIFPDKETVLCISVASRPSNFGMTVHNAAYRALGLNFLYKAFGVTDLVGALVGVRTFGIRGCSVSMPFKEEVIPLLDALDPAAKSIGVINTIVNDAGRLTGYNTDAHGAEVVLARLDLPRKSRVLILGAGGVARAILYALWTLGYTDITLANRSPKRLVAWPAAQTCSIVRWADRDAFAADLIINATSVGMGPDADGLPIREEVVTRARAVMDVIVTPLETRLIQSARAQGKTVICGHEMSLYQAARQFELYTGKAAPLAVMEDSVKKFLETAS